MEGASLTAVIVGILIGAVLLGGTLCLAKGACAVKSGCCGTGGKDTAQKV